MPPLDAYNEATQKPNEAVSVPQTTRENSREAEPKTEHHDIAGAPMEGLFEATQLSTLRARLRGDPNKKSSRRRVEADLLSQGVITLEEAEEMLHL